MSESLFPPVIKKINSAKHITLLSHVRPDGDAFGSVLALGLSLKKGGKKISILNEDGLTSLFKFLPGSNYIQQTPEHPLETDLVISLDTSTHDRLGKKFTSWNRSVDINIDHHISNTNYAEINIIYSNQPATACIVQLLIEEAGYPLDEEIAANLFVGITTDTGSFKHRGTTAQTFEMTARLVKAGADPTDLAKECYQSFSPSRFKLSQLAMQYLKFESNDSLAIFELTPDMFIQTGASSEDTEGIVESALAVKTVEVSVFFEFRQQDSLKVSLRSKGKINVSEIAREFGGGGHPGAAGIDFPSASGENQQKVLDRLRQHL